MTKMIVGLVACLVAVLGIAALASRRLLGMLHERSVDDAAWRAEKGPRDRPADAP